MSTGLGSSNGVTVSEPYGPKSDPTSYLAHLVSHATSGNDNLAINSLPDQANDPVNNQSMITLRDPLARALGFNAPTASDGSISINTGICNIDRTSAQNSNNYDLQAVISHELDEILAGGSALDGQINGNATPTGSIEPLDLYRYSAAGTRSFTTTRRRPLISRSMAARPTWSASTSTRPTSTTRTISATGSVTTAREGALRLACRTPTPRQAPSRILASS